MPEIDRTTSAEQIREVVLSDHAALRARLSLLKSAAAHAAESGDGRALTLTFRSVLDHLENHMRLEDQLLLPSLRSVPNVGGQVADTMAHAHESQRELLAQIRVHLEGESVPALVAEVRGFVTMLENEMEHEESTALTEELLNDDWIRIDFGG